MSIGHVPSEAWRNMDQMVSHSHIPNTIMVEDTEMGEVALRTKIIQTMAQMILTKKNSYIT